MKNFQTTERKIAKTRNEFLQNHKIKKNADTYLSANSIIYKIIYFFGTFPFSREFTLRERRKKSFSPKGKNKF